MPSLETSGARPPFAHRRTLSWLVLIAGFSSSYWSNFIWFHLKHNWGQSPTRNLVFNAGFGLLYTLGNLVAGRVSRRLPPRVMLMAGFGSLIFLTSVCAYATSAEQVGFIILAHAFIITWTWPNLEMLMSRGLHGLELGRAISHYNIAWALSASVSYALAGKLYAWHPLTLFAIPCIFWFVTLGIVIRFIDEPDKKGADWLRESDPPDGTKTSTPEEEGANPPPIDPLTLTRLRNQSRMGNMISYILISTMLPLMPSITARLGFSIAGATAFGAIWFIVRVGTFLFLGRWHGWHYRAGLFHAALLIAVMMFGVVTLSSSVLAVGVAQAVLGLAIGVIYSSALFYSMHGEAETSSAAIHEAIIGVGIMSGPLMAAAGGVIAGHFGGDEVRAIGWTVLGILSVFVVGLFVASRKESKRFR
ncbi:MFS transporter [Candidatus Sumerlaeota bacterium]|nr:MFS transporter [Candidatus Sumerlaeota bacterium]